MAVAYLESLNPEQRRAVEHGVDERSAPPAAPLLVIAGAGSGKTNTLAHRVAHLIVNGADPRRILLMTFSRRAAAEMTRRVERIARTAMGSTARAMIEALTWTGTFHSIGARLLREYAEQIGIDPAFTIHDREDSTDLMNLVRHELGFSKTESRFPTKATCLAIYSRCINAEAPIEEVLRTTFPWFAGWDDELEQLFGGYVDAKQRQNVFDYDDLLLYWAQMMIDPVLADDVGSRFDHVLIDEYQDTNRLQSTIVLALKPNGRGLTVVGDDAQSIYSFRAATVRNILDLPIQFSPPAEIVTLERNYRSTQPILAAANGVIGLARERFTKNLWTERSGTARPQLVAVRDEAEQARYIVERVLENREGGSMLKQQAVLFRTSHHCGPLEVELTRRNIPFVKFGGLRFLDAAHIRDVLALLRFGENPSVCSSSSRVSGRPLPATCSTTWRERLIRSPRSARPSRRRVPLTIGGPSSRPSPISVPEEIAGPPNSAVPGPGTNRTSNVCMKTPPPGVPIWFSSNRSPADIPPGRVSSPTSRSIRRMPPAIRPACQCSTRTTSFSPPFIPPKARSGSRSSC